MMFVKVLLVVSLWHPSGVGVSVHEWHEGWVQPGQEHVYLDACEVAAARVVKEAGERALLEAFCVSAPLSTLPPVGD